MLLLKSPLSREPWFLKALAPATPEVLDVAIRDHKVMTFGDDHGIIVVQDLDNGDVEWHWFLDPKLPAKEKRERADAVIDVLRTLGFRTIVGLTPADNMPARVFNRYMGAVPVEKRDNGIVYLLKL